MVPVLIMTLLLIMPYLSGFFVFVIVAWLMRSKGIVGFFLSVIVAVGVYFVVYHGESVVAKYLLEQRCRSSKTFIVHQKISIAESNWEDGVPEFIDSTGKVDTLIDGVKYERKRSVMREPLLNIKEYRNMLIDPVTGNVIAEDRYYGFYGNWYRRLVGESWLEFGCGGVSDTMNLTSVDPAWKKTMEAWVFVPR